MPGKALLDHFSALEDPRQAWKVVYPLPEILLCVLCATMAGAEDFVEIERWARKKLAVLRRFLPFGNGIPSHDTLNDVINALPAELFSDCFVSWVTGLRDADADIVAVDGKTASRPQQRQGPKSVASCLGLGHAPAARAGAAGLHGEVQRDYRHTGAAGTPGTDRRAGHHRRHGLPDRHCQSHSRQRRRLSAVPEGQLARALRRGSRRFFADANAVRCRPLPDHRWRSRPHRSRRHVVCHDIDWLTSDRRFPGEWRFDGPDRHGRVPTERAGKSYRTALLSLLRQALRTTVRRRRAPIGTSKPAPLGHGCRLPRPLCACAAGTAQPTWPPSGTWPSTSSTRSTIRPASSAKKTIGWDDDYLFAALTASNR